MAVDGTDEQRKANTDPNLVAREERRAKQRKRRVIRRAEGIFAIGQSAQFRVTVSESFRMAEDFEREVERLHSADEIEDLLE